MNTPGQPELASSPTATTNFTWYRGDNTEFLPNVDALYSAAGIQDYVVKGWNPQEPFITPTTNITAFGSCFAAHISEWLSQRNYHFLTDKSRSGDAYVIRCGEGMVNSFTLAGQFEWAFEGRVPQGEFWHGYSAEAFGYDETIRRQTQEIFLETDLFILTFGLSEIWYDKPSGEVFWRAIPSDKFDPERHGFRVASVAENQENIAKIYRLIRKHVPKAKVVFTVAYSPDCHVSSDVLPHRECGFQGIAPRRNRFGPAGECIGWLPSLLAELRDCDRLLCRQVDVGSPSREAPDSRLCHDGF